MKNKKTLEPKKGSVTVSKLMTSQIYLSFSLLHSPRESHKKCLNNQCNFFPISHLQIS